MSKQLSSVVLAGKHGCVAYHQGETCDRIRRQAADAYGASSEEAAAYISGYLSEQCRAAGK
jgi:hypothetical protein